MLGGDASINKTLAQHANAKAIFSSINSYNCRAKQRKNIQCQNVPFSLGIVEQQHVERDDRFSLGHKLN